MRLLITNDDGIDAMGLRAFANALRTVGEVVVVAPSQGCSCCGHSVTTTRPLSALEVEPGWFAVDGWPADCVRVGLLHLNIEPDWVLSGINHGGNLGMDVWMSGTVAAAREARLLGYRSAAFSQYLRRDVELEWEISARRGLDVFHWLSEQTHCDSHFWNVNLPALSAEIPLPSPTLCPLDHQPMDFSFKHEGGMLFYQSDYHNRSPSSGSDVDRCFAGIPSVSLMPLKPVI